MRKRWKRSPAIRSEVDRVSVVVPTYNRAELLKLTLSSILSQTAPALEVIVVDDGSTDHTAQVCAGLTGSVRYIRQENRGLPAARNTGIRASMGEWIAFCDSDDIWVADKLAIQIEALRRTTGGWSVSDFSLIDPNGGAFPGNPRGFERSFAALAQSGVSAEKYLSKWLLRREVAIGQETIVTYTGDAFGMLFLGNVALPSSAVVARDVIDRVGMFDESFRVAEETEFFHRVSNVAPVTIVMRPLCKYRVGHASIIAGSKEPLIQYAIRSLKRAVALRPNLTRKELKAFRKGRQKLHIRLAYTRLAAFDGKGARQALAENMQDQIFQPASTAILLASFLPNVVLRGLHRGKRAFRSIGD
jgi:glycosyltransferase involved in cell wall biosynthesis